MNRVKQIAVVACLVLTFTGCDVLGSTEFTPEVVVSGLLIAGEPLPPIRLAESGPIDEFYDPIEQSIDEATVSVHVLSESGSIESTVMYSSAEEGFYTPVEVDTVRGGTSYRLEVSAPGYPNLITGETVVPQDFEVVEPPPAEVIYQAGPSPRFTVSGSANESRQSVYVLKVEALDPGNFGLTPFAASLVEDRDVDPEDLITASSPLLNESNYTVNPDGSIQMSVVWLAFNFYGPQEVTITALDDALVAFMESQAIQVIPTTLSPGEIPNVVSNIQNGTGIFGSVAQVTTSLTVLEE